MFRRFFCFIVLFMSILLYQMWRGKTGSFFTSIRSFSPLYPWVNFCIVAQHTNTVPGGPVEPIFLLFVGLFKSAI